MHHPGTVRGRAGGVCHQKIRSNTELPIIIKTHMNQTAKHIAENKRPGHTKAQHNAMPAQLLSLMCLTGSIGFIVMALNTQDALTRQFSVAMAIIGFALFSSTMSSQKNKS